jgi:predicted nucleic acid-binding protein
VVLDASVVLKWAIVEDHSEQARSLFLDAWRSNTRLAAPPILRAELTNAVYKRERRGTMSTADVGRVLSSLLALPIEIVDRAALYPRALAIAREHGLPATYDAEYLALASMLDADFWTADERLYRNARSSGRVRWVAEYRGAT